MQSTIRLAPVFYKAEGSSMQKGKEMRSLRVLLNRPRSQVHADFIHIYASTPRMYEKCFTTWGTGKDSGGWYQRSSLCVNRTAKCPEGHTFYVLAKILHCHQECPLRGYGWQLFLFVWAGEPWVKCQDWDSSVLGVWIQISPAVSPPLGLFPIQKRDAVSNEVHCHAMQCLSTL